ncbi:MAG: hypothetical protein HQK78_15040 [Desulfobacterales bacterium]|nr:hypothetical protein [Desulfobacterales bacterium]
MSIEEMLQKLGGYNLHLLFFFIAIPTTAFVYGKLHKAGTGNYKNKNQRTKPKKNFK